MPVASSALTKVAEVGGSLKQVNNAFQTYQVARMQFVNALVVSRRAFVRSTSL